MQSESLRLKLIVTFLVGLSLCSCFRRAEIPLKEDLVEDSNSLPRLVNYRIPLTKLVDSLKIEVTNLKIKITKSEYVLGVYNDTLLLKNYPVVFGPDPENDKLRRGDGRTPEGIFKLKSKYPHKTWSKFIWIDYPNEESWRKHDLAKKDGLIPVDSDIGGNIGIHGIPEGGDYAIDYRQNWTLGCISMKNADVNEIYPFIHPNIMIEILH
jgi:murein L,D-transpeptidase YafK